MTEINVELFRSNFLSYVQGCLDAADALKALCQELSNRAQQLGEDYGQGEDISGRFPLFIYDLGVVLACADTVCDKVKMTPFIPGVNMSVEDLDALQASQESQP